MLNPAVEEMLDIRKNPDIESKFELVNVIAARARQLNDGATVLTETEDVKPVSVAMWEIYAAKVMPVKKKMV